MDETPKLLNFEAHTIHMYGLTFEEPNMLAEPGTTESCLEVKFRVVGTPASISALHGGISTPIGPDTLVRLANGLGGSFSGPSDVPAYVRPLLRALVSGSPLDFEGAPVPADVQAYLADHYA